MSTRETGLQRRTVQGFNHFLKAIAYVVGGIMGLGAMFGALTPCIRRSAPARVEIATLRAIGFGGVAVMVSVMSEALLLALAGSLIGAHLPGLAFNGNLHSFGGNVIQSGRDAGADQSMALLFACAWVLSAAFSRLCARRGVPIVDALRAT